MDSHKLTERQQREREYYSQFSDKNAVKDITFDPVLGTESRPWNSYWFMYECVLREYQKGRRTLLDFGCGNGASAVRFAKIGFDVCGFDITPNNIELGHSLAEKYGLRDNVDLSVRVAENTSYLDEQFDIIVGIDILHHIEIKVAIKECHRILKNGGVAIFREHVEAPLLDRIRNMQFITKFFSKEKSFDNHITEDERKLVVDDINDIKEVFPNIEIKRFLLFSRIDRFIRKPDNKRPSLLEKIDHFLFTYLPFLRVFGGGVVIVVRK